MHNITFTPHSDDFVTIKKHEIIALKALRAGTATPEQQIAALNWIVIYGCAVGEDTFRNSDRETAYQCGRRRVGVLISRVIDTDLSKLVD